MVSSTPLGGDLFEQTQSVTVLTGEELELRLEPTIGETLNREPGISSTYFGPGASRPVIRGLGEDRIRVLQNGVTTIDVIECQPRSRHQRRAAYDQNNRRRARSGDVALRPKHGRRCREPDR